MDQFREESMDRRARLPEPLGERYPGIKEIEGIGLHWMTAPKPGREMRDDLAERAREAASRAREAGTEWKPLFQRETNGAPLVAPAPADPVISEEPLGPDASDVPIDSLSPEGEEPLH